MEDPFSSAHKPKKARNNLVRRPAVDATKIDRQQLHKVKMALKASRRDRWHNILNRGR